MRQHGGAVRVREVLTEYRLFDLDAIRHIQKVATGEEGCMQRGESITVSTHKREQGRLEQLRMPLCGGGQRFEDDAVGQRGLGLLESI